MTKRPQKNTEFLSLARKAVREGNVLYTYHSGIENPERGGSHDVKRFEVNQAIMNGRHEPARDRWDDPPGRWSYAIRGRTLDGRELRVVVAFYGQRMRIVTVYDLEKGGD